MPKWWMKARLPQLTLAQCLYRSLGALAAVCLCSFYGQYDYTHVSIDKLQHVLYRDTAPFLHKANDKLDCNYDHVLNNERSINSWKVPMKYDDFSPNGIGNGSYSPQHCNPAFSVAILVTYRNRQKQLDVFLPYMHNFLRKQNIHYKIYLIEQRDEKPWNKGVLYNVGAKRAIAEQFPCLVLHDVDLLPLDEGNLYACTTHPRHMSASIDKFRYVLPYEHLVGGVMAIKADQYVAVDGFSNRFTGWGGEDDDIADRIGDHDLTVLRYIHRRLPRGPVAPSLESRAVGTYRCRFPRALSRYTMLKHQQEERNADRLRLLSESRRGRRGADGFASTRYRTIDVKQHRLFTLIAVTL